MNFCPCSSLFASSFCSPPDGICLAIPEKLALSFLIQATPVFVFPVSSLFLESFRHRTESQLIQPFLLFQFEQFDPPYECSLLDNKGHNL